MSQPLVLGLETSCDETAIGLVRGRTLLANVISSSVEVGWYLKLQVVHI